MRKMDNSESNMKKRKYLKAGLGGIVLSGALILGGKSAVFAATPSTQSSTENSYSYLTGQQSSQDRAVLFDKVSGFATDEERENYFEAQGIGEGSEYSEAEHIDAETYVEAGIINQDVADAITGYAAQKHAEIDQQYQSMEDMTPQEREQVFSGVGNDGFDGDSLAELVDAGILTQEQADAMEAYQSEQ